MNIYKLNDIRELPFATAVTVGMFDGVHNGHRHILARLGQVAEEEGVRPVVVTFDRHPRLVLLPPGEQPPAGFRLTTNEERYGLLAEAGVGDVVEIGFTPEEARLSACDFFRRTIVARLRARALVLGFDNMFGSKAKSDFHRLRPLAEGMGVRVSEDTALLYEGREVSSTQIRKALGAGDVGRAAAMLGYEYRVSGRVGEGRRVGRSIGFPTANVVPDSLEKALPADGVYCVRCLAADGSLRTGMANLGGQPTFGLSQPTFEVHLIDYEGDLYGQTLVVRFVERLRDIRRFDSPEALAEQLAADRAAARAAGGRPSPVR